MTLPVSFAMAAIGIELCGLVAIAGEIATSRLRRAEIDPLGVRRFAGT